MPAERTSAGEVARFRLLNSLLHEVFFPSRKTGIWPRFLNESPLTDLEFPILQIL